MQKLHIYFASAGVWIKRRVAPFFVNSQKVRAEIPVQGVGAVVFEELWKNLEKLFSHMSLLQKQKIF